MRLLGYTRVGTAGQNAQPQIDALVGAGVQKRDVFSSLNRATSGYVYKAPLDEGAEAVP